MRPALGVLPLLLAACATASPGAAPEPPAARPPVREVAPTGLAPPADFVVPESGGTGRIPVPRGVRVSLECDSPEWFVGESVELRFVLRNLGEEPLRWGPGAGEESPFAVHPDLVPFHVRAIHEDGRPAPDAGTRESLSAVNVMLKPLAYLMPGDACDFRFDLDAQIRIDRPGTWTIWAGHAFGWRAEPGNPVPVAGLRLRFRENPDPEALETVEETLADGLADASELAEARYLPYLERAVRTSSSWSVANERGRALAAIEALATRDPEAAVPVLERLARDGAIGGRSLRTIASRSAARALVGLLESDPGAASCLLARLPVPRDDPEWYAYETSDLDPGTVESLRASWDPALAPIVKSWALRSLEKEEDQSPARLLHCLAGPSDSGSIREAIERLLQAIPSLPLSEEYGRLEVARELLRTLLAVSDPRPAPSIPPRTPLELLLLLEANRLEPAATEDRPPSAEWERGLHDLLGHPFAWVRHDAASQVRDPGNPSVAARIAGLLRDESWHVRVEACRLARESKDPAIRDLLLERVREDPDAAVVLPAFLDGCDLGRRGEYARALAGRLKAGDPLRWDALWSLSQAFLEDGAQWELLRKARDSRWEPMTAQWTAFVDAVEPRLGPEDRVPLSDPAVKEEMFRGLMRCTLPDGRVWPSRTTR